MESTLLAYLAGILDGEGCIGLYGYHGRWRTRTKFRLDVKVGMAEPHAVKLFMELFGGSVHSRKKPARSGGKPSYTWCVSGRLAVHCLEQLVPYLRVKRAQAELALEFDQTRKGMGHKHRLRPYTAEEFATLRQYGEALAAAKREIVLLQ